MEAMKASNDIFKIFIGKPYRALRHTSPRVRSAQGNTPPKERDVDVLGYFPKEERDHVSDLIDSILALTKKNTLEYIQLLKRARELKEARAAALASEALKILSNHGDFRSIPAITERLKQAEARV